jgi:3-phytase
MINNNFTKNLRSINMASLLLSSLWNPDKSAPMKHLQPFLILGLALLMLCFFEKKTTSNTSFPSFTADAETEHVRLAVDDDAADDPSIWVNPQDSSKSLLIGTVKHYGIEVYNLKGKRLQSYPTGDPNNIDVTYDFVLNNGEHVDLVGCSERSKNEIYLYRIGSQDATLQALQAAPIKSGVDEVYGFCFYRSRIDSAHYAFVNGKNGQVEQWRLMPSGADRISAQKVRTYKVSSQPEGMVADPTYGVLYVGEEDKGIWRVEIENKSAMVVNFVANSGQDNPNITFDVEGLCLYALSDSTGYLLASVQGNNSYAAFERKAPNRYLGSFSIADGKVDGTAETDGIEVCAKNLGSPFRGGVLVVQDGFNVHPNGKAAPQNFKLMALEKISAYLQSLDKKQ